MNNFASISLCLILVILLGTSCKYKKADFVGVYVNNYSEKINKRMIPHEAPGKKDTLTLFNDNTFLSSCFGEGNKLKLKYQYFNQLVLIDIKTKEKLVYSRKGETRLIF